MKKTLAILLTAIMIVSMFAVFASAEEVTFLKEPVEVDLNDDEAVAKAQEAKGNAEDDARNFDTSRLPMIVLPCNNYFKRQLQAAVDICKAIVNAGEGKLYTAETYGANDITEGTWQGIHPTIGIYAGFAKPGWIGANIGLTMGDLFNAGQTYEQVESFMDVLNETIAETQGLDLDAIDDFKHVMFDLMYSTSPVSITVGGTEYGRAKWFFVTTDCECRLIEQIYYDLMGTGVSKDEDTFINENPNAIEAKAIYLKGSKKCTPEEMAQSVQMIAAKYQEMADKYENLKDYADNFKAYADAKYPVEKQEDPKTSDPKTSDPKTSDPKQEEPKTSDPKTSDPKTSDPKQEQETVKLTKVSGKAATAEANGYKSYYTDGQGNYFSDSKGQNKIEDLEAWKVGAGKVTYNPGTVDFALTAMAITSIVTLAGAMISKKAR